MEKLVFIIPEKHLFIMMPSMESKINLQKAELKLKTMVRQSCKVFVHLFLKVVFLHGYGNS